MTAAFGPSSGGGPGNAPGSGMMGQGYGMMGRGMMGGMSIRINKASAKAGKVTFDVTNFSRSIVHEMIVAAVDNPNVALPYDYNTGRIPEEQIKMLGETAEMQPDAEKIVTLDLQPGSYLLILQRAGSLRRRHVDAVDRYAIEAPARKRRRDRTNRFRRPLQSTSPERSPAIGAAQSERGPIQIAFHPVSSGDSS